LQIQAGNADGWFEDREVTFVAYRGLDHPSIPPLFTGEGFLIALKEVRTLTSEEKVRSK